MKALRVCGIAGVISVLVACSSSEGSSTSSGGSSSSSSSSGGADGGADGGDEASTPTADCSKLTNVSDGKTTDDAIAAGAAVLICYYPQPTEGYCRKITDAAKIAMYTAGQDKGAIGCKDAVILAGPDCPTKNAVGKCDANSIEAQRVYYKCSKFPDPKAHCGQITGNFTAL